MRNTEVSLKSENNDGHFTGRPIHIFDHISLNSSQNEKGKVKVKAVCGSYSTAALRHTVLLPE